MSVDERSRLQLAEAAKRLLGDEEGITLMELLPSVGWADVATKQDLELLEHKLGERLERELRGQTWKLFTLNATAIGAMFGVLLAVAKI